MSTITLPLMRPLIDVYGAISSGNEQALQQLQEQASDQVAFRDTVHKSIGYCTVAIQTGRARPNYVHGQLWMLPVVAHPGSIIPREIDGEVRSWIKQTMDPYFQVCALNVLPAFEAIKDLTPTGLYALLETLLTVKERHQSPLEGQNLDSTIPFDSGLPRLHFIVGSVASAVEPPTVPDHDSPHLRARITQAMLLANDQIPDVGKQVSVGMPARFAQALVDGLLLWLDALALHNTVEAWSMDTMGRETVALSIAYQNKESGETHRFTCPLYLWQIGANGLEAIMARCAVWPMRLLVWPNLTTPQRLS